MGIDDGDSDPLLKWLRETSFPFLLFKTLTVRQNLWSWFLDMNPPSPHITGLLNKASFLFPTNAYLPNIGFQGVCSQTWLQSQDFTIGFVVVQLLSCVRLFATPWIAAHQASLSFTISWSLLKLMSVELVMPSNHLVPCHSLLFLPSIFPSIRVLF